MHSSAARKAPGTHKERARKGFTLIELLVALALVDTALLALLATSAFVVRELGAATSRATAIAIARARIERLASTACDTPQSGHAVPGPGLREWWSDSPASSDTRIIADSVEITTRRGPVSVVFRGRRSC